jgi:Kef-type K+ transport system membrane component KefB
MSRIVKGEIGEEDRQRREGLEAMQRGVFVIIYFVAAGLSLRPFWL